MGITRGIINAINGASISPSAVTTGDGTIGGDPILGGPATSSDASLSFGNWATLDAAQPTFLELELKFQTDGTTDGQILVDIDESGDTTADSTYFFEIGSGAGSGADLVVSRQFYIPTGAQVRVRNSKDPNNANSIVKSRQWVISS